MNIIIILGLLTIIYMIERDRQKRIVSISQWASYAASIESETAYWYDRYNRHQKRLVKTYANERAKVATPILSAEKIEIVETKNGATFQQGSQLLEVSETGHMRVAPIVKKASKTQKSETKKSETKKSGNTTEQVVAILSKIRPLESHEVAKIDNQIKNWQTKESKRGKSIAIYAMWLKNQLKLV